MMYGLELNHHIFATVPRIKLPLLLIKCNEVSDTRSNSLVFFDPKWIFQQGDWYDVVICVYGSYPYQEKVLTDFITKLHEDPHQLKV